MKRFVLITLLTGASLGLSMGLVAQVVNQDGVAIEDNTHLGLRNLVLNGTGVRKKYIIDIYVAALYLREKMGSAEQVIADPGEKRIALHLVNDISTDELLYLFVKAIKENHNEEQLAMLKDKVIDFEVIFHNLGELHKRDVIELDYLPDTGTRVTVNGSLRGLISGGEFYTALLKVWLGEHPVQENLKLKLLGG